MEIKKRNRKVSQFSGMILSNKIETPTWTKLVPGIPLLVKKPMIKYAKKFAINAISELHHTFRK